uniref:Uncharacterized protein n=1 Tax=Anguilla anguilla TaxID=7936 RepID=A0A0E9WU52_ANGAN
MFFCSLISLLIRTLYSFQVIHSQAELITTAWYSGGWWEESQKRS